MGNCWRGVLDLDHVTACLQHRHTRSTIPTPRSYIMPPRVAKPVQRKGPAFKPPRPIKSPAQTANTTTTNRASGANAARSAPANKKPTAARPKAQPATTIISSGDEDEGESEDEDILSLSDRDEPMDDASDEEEQRALPPPDMPRRDPITPGLLALLLQQGFDDPKIGIQRGAMLLVEEYMRLFVKEAVARARYERNVAKKSGVTDGFLQVEDLEKLTPQLVLDF
ncbi:CENP-S associating centromere protein X-domain-containing protein [Clohesyomyces aquaticus]|uniref:CENP-S associating centromere protein X-domain-containing protein n=1 Tax=Clohesyomyces aquaticus TaxID=1231657 RepID=A0A1Y1ZU67_9PLEO|nr:CENP-S associating centromere protein X-domain-containing protein [Clohesyomyces aquaticus]